jgi:hypothetical protein
MTGYKTTNEISGRGMPPLKWSTFWDMIIPFSGGLGVQSRHLVDWV